MTALNRAYDRVRAVIGGSCEEFKSVELVELYRQYFRPDHVRVVLLAESHVFTTVADRRIAVPSIPELPGYPQQYARFVYCLGYGEPSLTEDLAHPKRDGTPQFWKLLFSCRNRVESAHDFSPILGKTPQADRLQNKIRLLADLKANGVWLVDTSVVALYKQGTKMPNMHQALWESWIGYTRNVVSSADPEHVICVGKGVAGVVADDLRRHVKSKVTIIPQPNAFLSSSEHLANFQQYSAVCLAP